MILPVPPVFSHVSKIFLEWLSRHVWQGLTLI